MKKRQWLWVLAVLPLVGVPLIAQQAPPAESPDAAPAPPVEPPPAGDTPEPAARASERPADERISADNSLSFPVDI